MTNLTIDQLIAAQGMPPQGMVRIPSDAERMEILRIQGMQVRTQAASMASAMLQHRQTSVAVWTKWAKAIEAYIQGGGDRGNPSASVLPRAQAS